MSFQRGFRLPIVDLGRDPSLTSGRASRCFLRGLASRRLRVCIFMSLGYLRAAGPDVLTQGGRGLECTWERRCAWCATFPIGKHIMMYETGHAERKSRLSA
jgi:hypothetical protein